MHPVPIHPLPFIVAVFVKIVVGSLWFSPMLFLKEWQRLSGVTDEQMKGGMAQSMATWVIGAVVMTFILAHAVVYAGATTMATGAAVGFANWVGFVLIVNTDMWAATKGPFKLVGVNSGANLVSLVVMGAILAAWT